ncbi:translation initiation factor IF-2, partial [Candidatus Woesearchaeota archaeon CG_4_10_14_0_8_um_filter_47_5]
MNPRIRQPLVVVIGHVDHGKTKLLDTIRGTAIGAGEKGGITQTIGASALPLSVLKKICGNLLDLTKKEITIPGLLFIDSPGHAAFTNLRKRGGNIANIAILVVDINEGFKPQTIESIDILKQYRTPFVVAANKIDLISGWKSNPDITLLKSIADQPPGVQETLSTKLYELVGALHEKGFGSERFDRIEDYTKQVALVPCSAKTREGIPELLMVLVGLAQRFLQGKLTCDEQGFAKGTILEVKDERGLGKTLDVILYDGCLKKNDVIVIGGVDQPVVTKVRALFVPAPLSDTRDKKSKYTQVNEIAAATGIKIIAPDIDAVVSGMPLRSTDSSHL